MSRILAVLITLALPCTALAQDPNCFKGCPTGAPATNDVISRDVYTLSSNRTTKFADWVAYRVNDDNFGPKKRRNFKKDPDIHKDHTLETPDYTGANAALGTERGHQAPLASFDGHADWAQTNYLSNITPQKRTINNFSWKRLEMTVRELAEDDAVTELFVITGPLYERTMPSLPNADETHQIPSGYWKIVALEDDAGIELAAFVIGQVPSSVGVGSAISVLSAPDRITDWRK